VDFYSYQAGARRRTRWLVFAFVLALAAVVLALDAVLFTALGIREAGAPNLAPLDYALRHPGTAIFFSVAILGVISLASAYKSLELRGGGAIVARSLGGVRIENDTSDLKRRRLRNVVEEMAIASGVPVPEIYVLEQEPAINAFAAGHTPANAAITVTQGALDHLDRDELQGVIGHEFSHILNGDMRLNIQLMGWVFGLLVLALIGRTVLRFAPRGRDRRDAGATLAFALALMVLGYVGLLAGRILQAAVSRQRERLADASSVQFTRNPQGLKGALLKIAALAEGSELAAAQTEQVAHMLFAPGLTRIFATHPPLIERIRTLDPHFDPHELERLVAAGVSDSPPPTEDSLRAPATAGFVSASGAAASVPAAARSIASQVGQVETLHIAQAQQLRLRLPASLGRFSGRPDDARSLVLALLLSRDPSVRASQIRLLSGALAPPDLAAVESAAVAARDLAPMLRLPALLTVFPALRRATLAERQALARLAVDLINADTRVEVFEYCLAKLLEMLLQDEMQARAPHGNVTLEAAAQPIHVLFSVMARAGAAADAEARRSYETGMQAVLPMRRPPYVAYPDWPQRLNAALPTLEALHPFAKQAVIEGLVRTIATDDLLNVDEAELLRTTCALLHCPLPPLLPNPDS
jgi:Zn-dependent protease with chaperone function